MLPENQIPNALGLGAKSSASMMGSMGDAVSSAMAPTEAPPTATETAFNQVASQFRGAWKQLENLNGQFGGDSDKFRQVQVALESWFADITSKIPEEPAPQTPTY